MLDYQKVLEKGFEEIELRHPEYFEGKSRLIEHVKRDTANPAETTQQGITFNWFFEPRDLPQEILQEVTALFRWLGEQDK